MGKSHGLTLGSNVKPLTVAPSKEILIVINIQGTWTPACLSFLPIVPNCDQGLCPYLHSPPLLGSLYWIMPQPNSEGVCL